MKYSKALEVMMQLKAEYFYAFKDMPNDLFELKVKKFKESLEEYSDKEVDIALGFVIKENKTLPTTAHFIEVLENNRELLLPSPEMEWAKVKSIIDEMVKRSNQFSVVYGDAISYKKEQEISFNKLPQEIKDYYINYHNFLDVVYSSKLDIEKAKFIKNFPIFRKNRKKLEALNKFENKDNITKND